MSNYLQLHDIAYQLPNGNQLFSNISGAFSANITALIGLNGVGKSILAQILVGNILPTVGTVLNSEYGFYLPQTYPITDQTTISDLLGIEPILQALKRINNGSVDEVDFAIVGDHWNIENDALALLAQWDLSHYILQSSAASLSGGEQMRIRLAAAFLSSKSTLILDEPSNHLDIVYKRKLWKMIEAWRGAVILITHDPFLLNQVQHIVELTSDELIAFQGSFSEFREARRIEKERAIEALISIKQEEKKRLKDAQKQLERQQKRAAEANRARGNQNQAKILMDAQKNRSDLTSGKMQLKYEKVKAVGQSRIQNARNDVDQAANIVLHDVAKVAHVPAVALELQGLVLSYLKSEVAPLSRVVESGERIAIIGPNGIGKSLLLKVIADLMPAKAGTIKRFVSTVYLDQHLSLLDLERSVLEQISQGRTKDEISQRRMQLSQLGLPAKEIEKPSGLLSGGERLKAALALILYREDPVELLLLDEPNNHLDLESLEALESMLLQYPGTLMLVSHDMHFLKTINISTYLTQNAGEWDFCDEIPERLLD